MSLCEHGVRIEHKRCDRCEEIAAAESRVATPVSVISSQTCKTLDSTDARFTSRKPFTFTAGNLALLNRRGGCHCALCAKRFEPGDVGRWIYCNSTPHQLTGNFFACSGCDDGNDDSMRAKGKISFQSAEKAARAWGIHWRQLE